MNDKKNKKHKANTDLEQENTVATEVEIEIEEKEPVLTEIEIIQQKYDEVNDKYLRTVAEFDNFRKRTQREKVDIYASCIGSTVEKFLPVWDNFERASAFECGTEEYTKGIELIRTGFVEIMSSFKVETFAEVGDVFDPNIHNAVSHIEDENLGENVISSVLQSGYKMGDKVLRYAMVQTAN